MAYDTKLSERARIEFAPPPSTFPLDPYDVGTRDTVAMGDRGVCFWLSDTLIDTTGPERMHCSRVIQQVTGSDGLQRAASVEITFNPHHERLVVHAVRVLRDGLTREAATPEAFEVLRRELNLERAIYDGRVTAHMIVPDVRIGDVVETAYSLIGLNPVLKDALACFFTLQWSVPTIETRCRVRVPEGRALTIAPFVSCPPPEDTIADGVRELTWRLLDAETYRHEADAPPSYIGYAAVQVADRTEWGAVSDLFLPHYSLSGDLPADLAAAIDAIGAAYPDPAARTAEALRFVQRTLRYHSISVGEGGYRPRSIETIWATRYGDCKDASRLLTAVLTRLGVEACPALVNTWNGDRMDTTPPNATAFDHCIVRARIDGGVWWLDPTCAPQSGRLDQLTPALFHWALPLIEGAGLETMGARPLVFAVDAQEDWRFGKGVGDPAALQIITDYRGWRADDMRRWRENDGLARIARQYRESLESSYGAVSETNSLEWIDDPHENRLQVIETYSVERPFAAAESDGNVRFETRDDVVRPNLRTVETSRRAEPINLGYPCRWRMRSTMRFPVDVQISPWADSQAGPGVWGHSAFAWPEPRVGVLTIDLEIRTQIVPAVDAPAFFEFKRKMISMNGLTLVIPTANGKLKSVSTGQTGWRSWALVLFGVAVFAVIRALTT